ncbi:MAG: hypothetical protein LPD71_07990 [Shewanella sp.]|nr:hypothetical protein [Shewanella sp.]MCF1431504.1 hypothetical protein [Shewanella sp.]MCF1438674.1 hypothetical protein [Shewanella sp.]MCF1456328.1 hypothetical protein [Shewanella sp.]
MAQVVNRYQVPVAVNRTMSDKVDVNAQKSYEVVKTVLAHNSEAIVLEMLEA